MMHRDGTLQCGDIPCYPDVPPILVDDDDSVCYPCATVEQLSMDNLLEQLEEETEQNKKSEKKAKHCLWHTLVGNGNSDMMQLQQKLVSNLLCFKCMQEQLQEANCVEEICLDDAMIVATKRNVGFACTSNAKHSIKAVMAFNGWTNKAVHWPKTKGGSYIADNGKLPLRVRAIDHFLADPSHRGKSFGRALYKLEKKRGRELKFTAVDCERLKQNFNFWQQQNKGESYDVFQHHYHAVLDHRFGDHLCCPSKEEGGWCKFKNNNELIATSRKENRYCNRQKDVVLYELVKKVWEHFVTDLMLGHVYHEFMSQKSKSLHQQITCVAPKDKHFNSSMASSDRVALVMVTDSVGYESGMQMIFDEIRLDVPPVTRQYLLRRNEHRQYDHSYNKRLDVKNRRDTTKKENIRRNLQQKATDAREGMDYGPSIDIAEMDDVALGVEQGNVEGIRVENNSETVATEGSNNSGKKRKTPRSLVQCSKCLFMGHGTWRSAACKKQRVS